MAKTGAAHEQLTISIRKNFEKGEFGSIYDLFNPYPITELKDRINLNYNTIARRLRTPKLFTVEDIGRICDVFKIDHGKLIRVILDEAARVEKVTKKSVK